MRRWRKGWRLAWLASLLMHAGIFWWLRDASWVPREHRRSLPAEAIVVEPAPDATVVSTSREDAAAATDSKRRFLGEFDNRVKSETRSPSQGQFRQGGRGPIPATPGDGPGAPELADLLPGSASPNSLPDDIARGEETLLNTQRVYYASYMNRISDAVYEPWVRLVHDAVDDIHRRGGKLADNLYITRVAISLDPHGTISSIQVEKSSGVDALDEASKRAFWETEPYPNPPDGIFRDERSDQARLVYEFHFEYSSSHFRVAPFRI